MLMRDREVVASIVAGDPDGLATAYDWYADSLYKYCRTMLRDPADAADAVQDTFVIAAGRISGLRDPRRLRAWLYVVARNECLRIMRARKGTSALDEALDVTSESAWVSLEAGNADLRALFEAAKDGLNPGEREVIELQLRAGLEPAEVADVLGVSRSHGNALMSHAREQLEACLGVLLVSRAGRDQCGELGSMLRGWDERLTVVLRKRLHRHIEHCGTCAAARERLLGPAMLLDLSPGAALAAGAAMSFRVAPGAPEGLRGHTLALATGRGPAAAAHSAAVLSRAGGFTKAGFPKPAEEPGGVLAGRHAAGGLKSRLSRTGFRSPLGQASVAAAAVIAVGVAVAAFALAGNDQHFTPAANPDVPATSVVASSSQAATRASLHPQTAQPARSKPAPARTKPAAKKTTPAPARTTAPPPATTSAPPSPSASSASPTHSSSPTPKPTPTGTLSESPAGGTQSQPQLLQVQPGGPGSTIDLSVSGGKVSWSVSVGNDPNGAVSVSPASGTLTPGSPTATVTVTVGPFLSCDGGSFPCPTITISPGGAVYSIWTGGHSHHGNLAEAPAAALAAAPITTATVYLTETRRTVANPTRL